MRTRKPVAENVQRVPIVDENQQEPTNEVVSQAMLQVLEQVAGTKTEVNSCGDIVERLRSSRAELFRDVAGTTLTISEYWLEATERILDDMECTSKQKLKGTMSLLRDEAYR